MNAGTHALADTLDDERAVRLDQRQHAGATEAGRVVIAHEIARVNRDDGCAGERTVGGETAHEKQPGARRFVGEYDAVGFVVAQALERWPAREIVHRMRLRACHEAAVAVHNADCEFGLGR
ncbi:hypothetical protein [Trinickia caryophylli]|uniref:hypothetical protein n=1 Tax=Trinickia caryophylli TaxID=28094 RepID=UPI000C87F5F1|nr:hypothetical protein [Trinickia caryophylli]PMS12298.1 hypothetical protein C0Z17_10035 [Trinickia caryophylli]